MLAYLTDHNRRFRYKNVVFFLGAGASYDHGYPLVSEFLSAKYLRWLCDQCEGLPAGAYAMVPKSQAPLSYALDEAKAFSKISTNFEVVLSTLFKKDDGYKRVMDFTNWVLASALSMVHSTELMSTAEYLGLAMMLFELNDAGESCVITFNYDTSAEDAVSSCGRILAGRTGDPTESLYFNYGFSDRVWDIFPKEMIDLTGLTLPMSYPGGRVLILKPHGSVNLTICDQCSAVHYSSVEALSRKFIFSDPDLIKELMTCKSCGRGSLNVFLIPPGKRKRIPPEFNHLWDLAEERLRSADLVVMAGYSVPAYDEEARTLLLETLRDKAVLLIDPWPTQATLDFLRADARARLSVLQQGFSDFLRYEMNALHPRFLESVADHCKPVYLNPERLQGCLRS